MPKREKTPSPGPDEPKFLSIFYPWPPYVTLGEEDESKKCARWLSCFIGQDNVYAMFHKPSSPNTIIVEISNELTNEKMRKILGQHEWEKMFPKYDTAEGTTYSRIFYSTFRTRREVEKTGWKIRVVTDDWFKGFKPTSGKIITYPYPATTFCEPPSLAEEVNALQLFRRLPADIFPEARLRPTVTETVSAPPTAPPPRVIPGSGGRAGASGSVAAAGGKGKQRVADPNVRPTVPVARSTEAGAKAKATHQQPVKITPNVYDEDSEGDDGYGNYAMHHQEEEEEVEVEEVKPKGGKPDEEVKDLAEGMQNAGIEDYGQGYSTPPFDPFIRAKQEEEGSDAELCPTHKKRCKPGICQWAADKKAAEKRLQKRTGGRQGQNTRRW